MPKSKVYYSRTDYLISKHELGDSELHTEDKVLQLAWTPEQLPTAEELKKRQEQRREQGRKLKEMNAAKREQKKKAFETELADLESLRSINDNKLFKEEILARNLANHENYLKRIKFLQVKLGIYVEP